MLFRALHRTVQQALLTRRIQPAAIAGSITLLLTPRVLTPLTRSFLVSAPTLQRAADVYSGASSSNPGGSNIPSSGGHSPPPPPHIGRHTYDRSGDREESREDQAQRYLRNLYLLSWGILLAVLLDWWNSSVAAGSALLTAHEVRTLFTELINIIQREDNLLRAEVVSLNENTRRSREELRAELAEARRDMLAVLLNKGRLGGGVGKQLNRYLGSGSSGGGNGEGSWLSSLAEKTGLRGGGGGGRTWDNRGDRGGDNDFSAWDAGFMSGLRTQLSKLAGEDSGDKTGGQPQPNLVGEAPAVDDRYKSAMGTQWTEARKDDKREGR